MSTTPTSTVVPNGVIENALLIKKKPFLQWPTVLPFTVVYAIVFSLYANPELLWSSTDYIIYQTYIDFLHAGLIPLAFFIHGFVSLFTVWSVRFRVLCLYSSVDISKLVTATHVWVKVRPHKGTSEVVPLTVTDSNNNNNNGVEVSFSFQQRKWVYNAEKRLFVKPVFPNKLSFAEYHAAKGHESPEQVRRGYEAFGKNLLPLDVPEFTELLVDHAFAPFFVFQMFCVMLWCLDEYWMYSIFTGVMMVVMECTVVMQRIRNMKTLRQMGEVPVFPVIAKRQGKFVKISSSELLPMDVIVVPSNSPCPADCVLVSGSCVANEAMLTGESTPQLKEPVDQSDSQHLVPKRDTRHILFGGTQILIASGPTSLPSMDLKSGALAVVIKTGFETKQGKLLRTILHSQGRVSENSGEAFGFIALLLVFAVAASGYLLRRGLADPTKDRWKLFLHCTQIITAVVPSELPMELSLAVNTSLIALMRLRIFCTEPFRIPFAGKLDTCCFDKTGTLTTDEMLFSGVDMADGQGLRYTMADIPHYSESVLAGCQALVHLAEGGTAGDAMEKAAVEALGYKVVREDVVSREAKPTATATSAGSTTAPSKDLPAATVHVVVRFPFNPMLRRMSTVITSGEDKLVVTKGSPEGLRELCGNTIPSNYNEVYEQYAASGLRVIALAYKNLPSQFRSKAAISTISREEAECDLTFAGFAVFNCPLKKDAQETIRNLIDGSHRCVVITGDNIQTALAVSRQVGIAPSHKHLIARLHKDDPEAAELLSSLTADPSLFPALVFDGTSGATADEKKPKKVSAKTILDNTYVPQPRHKCSDEKRAAMWKKQHDLCVDADGMPSELFARVVEVAAPVVSVWARCTPSQKEDIISRLKALNHVVLMAGDGTNDVGGLKQAQVGIAVLNSKAVETPQQQQQGNNNNSAVAATTETDPTLPPIPPGFKLTPVPPPLSANAGFMEKMRHEVALATRKAQIMQLQKMDKQRKAAQEKKKEAGADSSNNKDSSAAVAAPGTSNESGQVKGFESLMDSAFNQNFEDEMNPMIKLGDASIAAPFTAKSKRLMAVVDIVRNGRSTLVTTLQMYKILALNCLVSAYSLSVLHSDGVKMGDKQMMVTGVIISICFLCMSRCHAVEKLSSQRPITRVFHPYMICSIFGQFALHLYSIISSVKMVTDVDTDAIAAQREGADNPDFKPTLLNTVVFLMTTTMTATTFAVNYRGEPFMQSMKKNKPMFISLIVLVGLVFMFATEVDAELNDYFEIVRMPSEEFKMEFVQLLVVDMVGSYLIEMFCLKTMTDG